MNERNGERWGGGGEVVKPSNREASRAWAQSHTRKDTCEIYIYRDTCREKYKTDGHYINDGLDGRLSFYVGKKSD